MIPLIRIIYDHHRNFYFGPTVRRCNQQIAKPMDAQFIVDRSARYFGAMRIDYNKGQMCAKRMVVAMQTIPQIRFARAFKVLVVALYIIACPDVHYSHYEHCGH
ncbi:MAG: hypothetical protein FWE12_07695 [Oscillospiraceae bacterium]|nr:hypothetical protein [Oscillospiraceae bacterium]